jgi:hypothetical protein
MSAPFLSSHWYPLDWQMSLITLLYMVSVTLMFCEGEGVRWEYGRGLASMQQRERARGAAASRPMPAWIRLLPPCSPSAALPP